MPTHRGVTLHTTDPGRAADMATADCAVLADNAYTNLWFAGERTQADQFRKARKLSGRRTKQAYISPYWQRQAAS